MTGERKRGGESVGMWSLLLSQGHLTPLSGLHHHDSPNPGHLPKALPPLAITLVMRYKVSIVDQRGHDRVVSGDTHWHIDTAHATASLEAYRARASSSRALAAVATVASHRKEEIVLGKHSC